MKKLLISILTLVSIIAYSQTGSHQATAYRFKNTLTSDSTGILKPSGYNVLASFNNVPYIWNGSSWKRITFSTDVPNVTASNGITKVGNNFKLGGKLNNNTYINGKALYHLKIDTLSDYLIRAVSYDGTLLDSVGYYIYPGAFGITSFNNSFNTSLGLTSGYSELTHNGTSIILNQNNGITITDPSSNGLKFSADYSANYDNRSAIDLGFLRGRIGQFTKFTGPTTSDKTFTLPNASATILTTNAAVTAVQGGTGNSSYTTGDLIQATGTTTLSKLASVATGNALISGGVGTASSWGKIGLTTHVNGTLPVANGGTGLSSLGTSLQQIRVNSGGTSLEYFTPSGLISGLTTNYIPKATSSTAIGNSVIYDNSGSIGIGTTSPDRLFHVEIDNASNNTVTYLQRLTHTTSGTPGIGIGTGLEFETETIVTNTVGSTIESVTTDVTSTSEDFDLVFKNMAAGATAAERFRITSDGRIYGTALHNNSGSVTGTTNQYIASGTYTPTITGVTNINATTAHKSTWSRVGNILYIHGAMEIDPTSGSVGSSVYSELRFTLPISSALSNYYDCTGTANALDTSLLNGTGIPCTITADTVNDQARINFFAINTTNETYTYHFGCEIK